MTAVDRTYPLADPRFAHANPDRLHIVINRDPVTRFAVWRGTRRLREFVEHERAMTWAQGRAALDRHPDAPRYRLDPPRKRGQGGRTGAVRGPNYTHVISGPQNGSNEFDTFPEPMEAP